MIVLLMMISLALGETNPSGVSNVANLNRGEDAAVVHEKANAAKEATVEESAGESTEPEGFLDSLRKGTTSLALRYRVELVDDDGFVGGSPGQELDDALASTLRTQLGFVSAPWKGFSVHFFAEDVAVVGGETYNNKGAGSLNNGRTDRAVVADPDMTEISQAFLRYEPNEKVSLSLGRQEFSFGQQRFVGAVGWRQNHQEFDAINLKVKASDTVVIRTAFIDRVHTIVGGEHPMASPLLNVAYSHPKVKITGYGYWLDYDNPAQARLSSSTYGLRASGKFGGDGTWSYEAELAEQQDLGDHPDDFDVGYRALAVGWTMPNKRFGVKAGFELLEGDGSNGFRTPLATLHKFNGFADKFLATPGVGLSDVYVSAKGKVDALSWMVAYHQFESDQGSTDFGDELDLVVSYKASWGPLFGLKAALYEADDFSSDTSKVMLWTQWGF